MSGAGGQSSTVLLSGVIDDPGAHHLCLRGARGRGAAPVAIHAAAGTGHRNERAVRRAGAHGPHDLRVVGDAVTGVSPSRSMTREAVAVEDRFDVLSVGIGAGGGRGRAGGAAGAGAAAAGGGRSCRRRYGGVAEVGWGLSLHAPDRAQRREKYQRSIKVHRNQLSHRTTGAGRAPIEQSTYPMIVRGNAGNSQAVILGF